MTSASDVVPSPGPLTRILDDWWNPILVKEVRQALRGKFFRISFICTLAAVTVASFGVLLDMGANASVGEGRDFFMATFVCFAVATIGLVPFAAFNSMGAEWDENTFDLLVISNLKPRQIVLGKLLSALAQTLLFLGTALPYLVFSFLLQKVDLSFVVVSVVNVFCLSLTASVVAIALSTLSRVKFARIVLMAALAFLLSMVIGGVISFTAMMIRRPETLSDADFPIAWGMFFLIQLTLGAFCFGTACIMLSHAEENRSSGMRLLTTAVMLAGIAFAGFVLYQHPDRDAVSGMAIALLVTALVPAIFFATEPEALGRRVAPRVPRSRSLALLATPWLPGGGRGVLLYFVHLALASLFLLFGHVAVGAPSGRAFFTDGVSAFIVAALYGSVYLLLPSGLLSGFTRTMPMRAAIRALIPFLVLVFLFAPSLLGFMIGDRQLMEMEHAGNPFLLMDKSWNRSAPLDLGYWLLITVLLAFAALLNARRVWRGVREVLLARNARLARESARSGQPAPEAPDALAGA